MQEDEEDRRDYDMHRLAREEKLKGKKLRGKRKRKEIAREKAPGQDFSVDVADERFAAVLEGDTRFGIDRTDASFKVCVGFDSAPCRKSFVLFMRVWCVRKSRRILSRPFPAVRAVPVSSETIPDFWRSQPFCFV